MSQILSFVIFHPRPARSPIHPNAAHPPVRRSARQSIRPSRDPSICPPVDHPLARPPITARLLVRLLARLITSTYVWLYICSPILSDPCLTIRSSLMISMYTHSHLSVYPVRLTVHPSVRSVCLFGPSDGPSVCPICPSVHHSFRLSIGPSLRPSVYRSIRLSGLSVCPTLCPSVYRSARLFIGPSVCPVCQPVQHCPSVLRSVLLSVGLSVCPSVYLSVLPHVVSVHL